MVRTLPLASLREARNWGLALLRTERKAFTALLVLLGLATIAGLAGPRILGSLVDSVVAGTTTGHIDTMAAVFVGLLLVHAVLKRAARLRAGILGERVLADTRERFVARALRLPLDTVESAGTGDLLSRTTSDVDKVDWAVRHAVPNMLLASAVVLLTVVAMIVTSPLLAVALLLAIAVLHPATRRYWKRAPAVIEQLLRRWADVQTRFHETATGARTAEALGLTERRIHLGDAQLNGAIDGERAMRRMIARWVPFLELSHALPIAAMLLLGFWGYRHDWVSLGTITAMVLYTTALADPLDEMLWWTEDLLVAATALRRVLGVDGPAPRADGPAPDEHDITVSEVRFTYPTGREVLHGIDLHIPVGQHLAIVGPSGSGKSTLARLFAGIAAPSSGTVTIGGAEVAQLPVDVLRGEIMLLTQEHHVFTGTLRENLTLPARKGGGEFTDTELLDALATVGAAQWAMTLPAGLDSDLGAGNRAVPPAVAQQLALARVVLADPHTLVLDEATSLLDPESARDVEQSLSGVLAGRTVITIAHRLQSAAAADRVAVLEDGQVTELGSHSQLRNGDGPYAALIHAAQG